MLHELAERPNATEFLQALREWREVQNLICIVPEDTDIFSGALRREGKLFDIIVRYRADTGLEWDIQWFVRATNGLTEVNNRRYRSLSEQFDTLFGTFGHEVRETVERQDFDTTSLEGKEALALMLLEGC